MLRLHEICFAFRLLLLVVAGCSVPNIAAGEMGSLQNLDKQIAFDDRVVASTTGVELVQGRVTKHDRNPLMQAFQPWENSFDNLYPNVDFDAESGEFKLWYKDVLVDADVIAKLDPPRTVHDVGWLLLYAKSRDGLTWTKPNLGQIKFDGSANNNAVARDTPNVGVFRDTNPDCPSDRRFKMIYDTGLSQIKVRFSRDGLHWGDPIAAEGLGSRTGDTHNNAFWDARLRKYVVISRFVLGERLVARAESDDFVHWQPPTLALRSNFDEGRKRQTYCMPSFAYGNGYFGFVMMYNHGTDRTVDCELVWSPDSNHWRRPFAGQSFIPRGDGTAYDSKCIYAQANPPIVHDGKLWIYYGGDDYEHTGWKRHCLPCLATLPVDRFAGWQANKRGEVVTQPMRVSAKTLRASADVAGGSVQIVVFDSAGTLLATSEPIESNVTDVEVRWLDGFDWSRLIDRTVHLQFKLDRATLLAFTGLRQLPVPMITTAARGFDESLTIEIATMEEPPAAIYYTLDGHEPTTASPRYEGPLNIDRSVTLRARQGDGPIVTTRFTRRRPWSDVYPDRTPRTIAAVADFDKDTAGWLAVDGLEHYTDGGFEGGFIRVVRPEQQPYLMAEQETTDGQFTGDWPARFGGTGVRIEWAQRAATPHVGSTVELFAGDIAQWSFSGLPKATTKWSKVGTTI